MITSVENAVWDALGLVEGTSKRTEKMKLLETLCSNDAHKDFLRTVVLYACNPVWTYGVISNMPIKAKGDKETFAGFSLLLDKLKKRELTGNEAITAVRTKLQLSVRSHWYQRVLNRDLKIGVGVDTFLKLFPGLFPVMKPMLCETYEGGDLERPYIVQPKLDGVRCVIIVDEKKRMTALSRNNKTVHNIEHIFKELKRSKKRGYVLDGELFGVSWNTTLAVISTENKHPSARKIKFHVFDYVKLNSWQAQESIMKLKWKGNSLREVLGKKSKYIKVLPFNRTAQTVEEIRREFEFFHDAGYEGIVIKDPESPYEFKRSKSWLKVKAKADADLKIIKIEKGDPGSKYEHILGSIVVAGVIKDKGKKRRIITHVGTGFSDKQRNEFFKKRRSLIGKIAQVEYQEIAETSDKKQNHNALRFPVFVRLRKDK